jgi:hypothetical protein
MPPNQSLWFRIGYALERAKQGPPAARRALGGLTDRPARAPKASRPAPEAWPSADDLFASGAAALVAKVLDGWRPRGKTGMTGLLRAGAAGAAAALVVDLVRPLLRGEPGLQPLGRDTADRMLTGLGQGLVYGAVVEPRVPGPPLLKGTLYGTAEYAVDPMGGLARLLGSHAPQRRLPVVAHLLENLDPHDRAYLEHVVFGVAVALLYGSSRSSNGIRMEDDEE